MKSAWWVPITLGASSVALFAYGDSSASNFGTGLAAAAYGVIGGGAAVGSAIATAVAKKKTVGKALIGGALGGGGLLALLLLEHSPSKPQGGA